jgi:hypothetical protein
MGNPHLSRGFSIVTDQRPDLITISGKKFWKWPDGMLLPVISGGALPATDNFNGTNNQALTAYSSNWTMNQGAFWIQTLLIDYVGPAPNSTDVEICGHWNADTFSNDQYAQAHYYGEGFQIGPAVRCAESAATYYVFYTAGTDYTQLNYSVDGSISTIQSSSQTFSNGTLLRLEASSTTLTTTANGTNVFTPQTDNHIGSGYAGIGGYHSGVASLLNDWEGGNLSTPGPTLSVSIIPTNAAYQVKGVKIQ